MTTPVDRPPIRVVGGSSVGSHVQLTAFARRITLLGAMVAGLLALGTLGLAVTESVGPWYAFRWSLDTISTVGGFPQPHTTAGQIVNVGLIVLGVGTLFYALATVVDF